MAVTLRRCGGFLLPEDRVPAAIGDLETRIEKVATAALNVASLVPTGMIVCYGGSSAPYGWLLCDGSVYDRALYPGLFDVIGTTFNTGGESGTQFRVPDMRGRVAVHPDGGAGRLTGASLGSSGGAQTVTLSASEMPSHTHSWSGSTGSAGSHSHSITASSGSAGDHSHTASSGSAGDHTHSWSGTTSTVTDHTHTATISDYAGSHSHSAIDAGHKHGVDDPNDKGNRFVITYSPSTLYLASSGPQSVTVTSMNNDAASITIGSAGGHIHTVTMTGAGGHSHTVSGTTGTAGSHSHSVSVGTAGSHSHSITASSASAGDHTHTVTGTNATTGGGGAHSNVQPYLGINYIIRC